MVRDRAALPYKVAEMENVRSDSDGFPVELWMSSDGRLMVRVFNDGYTEVDLW